VNLPYSSTTRPSGAKTEAGKKRAFSVRNAAGVVLREMAAALGAALGVAAGVNLLLLWLGIGPA
jgi:hypothetical protein